MYVVCYSVGTLFKSRLFLSCSNSLTLILSAFRKNFLKNSCWKILDEVKILTTASNTLLGGEPFLFRKNFSDFQNYMYTASCISRWLTYSINLKERVELMFFPIASLLFKFLLMQELVEPIPLSPIYDLASVGLLKLKFLLLDSNLLYKNTDNILVYM